MHFSFYYVKKAMEDQITLLRRKKYNQSLFGLDVLILNEKSKAKVTGSDTLIEKVLVSKLKTGDEAAFSYLFTAYFKKLLFIAYRFTSDQSTSEELVQDTFVKLWESRETLDPTSPLEPFLIKILKNKCLDWNRHQKVVQYHMEYILGADFQFEAKTDSNIVYEELQARIDTTLAKLPCEIAEAFRMNRYQGIKYHEIAAILGVSVRTIEVRIGRALSELRYHLRDYIIILVGLLSFLS